MKEAEASQDPQALIYAEELRELYWKERTRADELKLAKESLEVAIERMLDAERLRDEFVANVSHELRTPLTPILGWALLLQKPERMSAEQMKEVGEAILNQGRRLSELVESLLLVASLGKDQDTAKIEGVDVESLLDSASLPLSGAGRPVEVSVDTGVGKPTADEKYLAEVLRRLVDNAIKFTPEASPVGLKAVREGNEIVLSVIDHGPGVAAEDRERIFGSFVQGDGSSTRAFGGVGIGLYICRQLVATHGGRIWVEETPGGGATFAFTLPG